MLSLIRRCPNNASEANGFKVLMHGRTLINDGRTLRSPNDPGYGFSEVSDGSEVGRCEEVQWLPAGNEHGTRDHETESPGAGASTPRARPDLVEAVFARVLCCLRPCDSQ
jgi:hypothetical protein